MNEASLKRIRAQPENAVPKTRAELMWWLHYHGPQIDYNIFKEGPQWVVEQDTPKGRKICATHQRRIDMTTFGYWRRGLISACW